jgi:hypothetical protein
MTFSLSATLLCLLMFIDIHSFAFFVLSLLHIFLVEYDHDRLMQVNKLRLICVDFFVVGTFLIYFDLKR